MAPPAQAQGPTAPGAQPVIAETPAAPTAAEHWTLRLTLATQAGAQDLRVSAQTTWLGEPRHLELSDDGTALGDVARDGIYVGVWTGPPVQALPIVLSAAAAGQSAPPVYQGTVEIQGPEDRLGWTLDAEGRAQRRSFAASTWRSPGSEARAQTATLGWLGLLLGVLGFYGSRSWRRPTP